MIKKKSMIDSDSDFDDFEDYTSAPIAPIASNDIIPASSNSLALHSIDPIANEPIDSPPIHAAPLITEQLKEWIVCL
jgi:hypothetical protein